MNHIVNQSQDAIVNSLQTVKFYSPPHKKLFQTILNFNVTQLKKAYSKRAENNMRKGENAGYTFPAFPKAAPSFFCVCENEGFCGRGLIKNMFNNG